MLCCRSRRSKKANASKSQSALNDKNATFHTSAIIRRPPNSPAAQQQPACQPCQPACQPCQPACQPQQQQAPAPAPACQPCAQPPRSQSPCPPPPPRPASANRCPIHYNNDYIQLVETGGFQNYLPELEGDVEALSLVDLDRYGLSDYKYLFPARHTGSAKPLGPSAATYSTHREPQPSYPHSYTTQVPQSYVPPSYIQSSYAPAPGCSQPSYEPYGTSYLY